MLAAPSLFKKMAIKDILWVSSRTSDFVRWSYYFLTSYVTLFQYCWKKAKKNHQIPRSFILFTAIHHLPNLLFPYVPLQPFPHPSPYCSCTFSLSAYICSPLYNTLGAGASLWPANPGRNQMPLAVGFPVLLLLLLSTVQSSVASADPTHIGKLPTWSSRILSQLHVFTSPIETRLFPLFIFL